MTMTVKAVTKPPEPRLWAAKSVVVMRRALAAWFRV